MTTSQDRLKRRGLRDENGSYVKDNSSSPAMSASSGSLRDQQKAERVSLVLWRSPFTTLYYCIRELAVLVQQALLRLWFQRRMVFAILLSLVIFAGMYVTEGSHQQYVQRGEKTVLWWAYWVGLGILSSVGLGTGLHTFVLYLGPHIASVTLAAYECNSLDFPEPPYPSSIVCPESSDPSSVTMWSIMSKVRLEAFMWGIGTAIGELPPYFMARAARLSSKDLDEDELEEIEEVIELSRAKDSSQLGFVDKVKLFAQTLVHRMGFFGILACASIPNPLFDLAGITCGHFLVSFWKFFGATAIGKAVIKMHIQKLFIIFMFSKGHVESLLDFIKNVPYGESLVNPIHDFLEKQKTKLHRTSDAPTEEATPWLGWIFEKLIIAMVAYFLCSIINSMAQSYHKRLCKANQTPHCSTNGNSTASAGTKAKSGSKRV